MSAETGPLSDADASMAYVVIDRIGVGGMAETFLAERRGPEGFRQRVCLKRVLPAFSRDAKFVRLFRDEARLSARLLHANIARVIDFGVEDERHYLALEMVDGLDLRRMLRILRGSSHTLPLGFVMLIALSLLEALEFAHAADAEGKVRGIVHRDISPANVLVSRAGEIKLTDFGIAKAMSDSPATRTHSIKGKVPYMAPEYALGGRYGVASDLFSLGVTLFELLAKGRPYDGVSEVETLQRAERGDHPPLAEMAPDAPPLLVEVVESMIRPDLLERPLDAREVLDTLAPLAPPWSTELELGRLVCALESRTAHLEASTSETESLSALESASPSGTLALPEESPERWSSVDRADADSPTRTRRES